MLDLDSFLVSLYVLVEYWWELEHGSQTPKRPGRPALLADSEVLTLAILAQWPRFRSERDFWRFARTHLRYYFSTLPSYTAVSEPVQSAAACSGTQDSSLAARSGSRARRSRCCLPRSGHYPDPGYRQGACLSQRSVRRIRHLRAQCLEDRVGLWLQGSLVGKPRRCHRGFWPGSGLLRRASDRRFFNIRRSPQSLPRRQGLYECGMGEALVKVLRSTGGGDSQDNSKRAWPEADRRWASGKRQIVEGVIDQLKDFFALERHRAKTLGGLLTRLAAKIAAYPCGKHLNVQLGRPPRHLAELLV